MTHEAQHLLWGVFLPLVLLTATTTQGQKWKQEGSIEKIDGKCPESYFPCVNDPLCIQQNNNCDGKADCPDKTDEDNCHDNPLDEYFDSLVSKRLSAIHDDDDKNCTLTYNGTCVCERRDIFCHMRRLNVVPTDIPNGGIEILDFTHNDFNTLSRNVFRGLYDKDIEKLSFVHCNVKVIAKKAFYDLTRIRHLQIDNNAFDVFPADAFPQQNVLVSLSLTYNNLSRIAAEAFDHLKQLETLDLRGNRIKTIENRLLLPLQRLEKLLLQQNLIEVIGPDTFPPLPLNSLSLVDNLLQELEPRTFSALGELRFLFLSGNHLAVLRRGVFANLSNLEVLALNDNAIKKIEIGVFEDTLNLSSLKLEHNKFRMLDKRVLLPLKKLPYIYFDRFELCMAATHVRVCYPKGDGISSQEHLLDNPVLRASVWIMGGIGCTGNIIVLLSRLIVPTNNVVHSLYLRNLALSDLLMGIYLFTIAGVDHHYRGVYLMHEFTWRHSLMCNLCGFLSTLSCESSVLILTLVTWDRFVSVTQPLARRQPSAKTASLTLLVLWSFASLVSFAPLSEVTEEYFGDEFYGSNGVCLSLHIHDPYAKGWEYSAMMFILVNAVALTFISYAYMRMINEIKASGVACRSTRQSQDSDKVAQRFGIIVLTDSLCWVPVIIVKMTALSGVAIPQDLYAWLAIFILPINSALNPILYTLTTTVFKNQVHKIVNSFLNSRRFTDHHHSATESALSLSLGVFPLRNSTRRFLAYREAQTQSSLTQTKGSYKKNPTAV
ncbi:relaxin receptor 2-like [Harmonia axyridis]|uniref:relaxin receptor 2-like n=1 Tax=Harmonia axyridis TaxID=115357 RepID=UPI001E275EDB|nr:relaxin receptor 2-like [Harmonia axyridis]XP_045467188.1 relaxin receptor 2-like [Harmonia axyridis]XP_045467190.1 relaxin receptor 2-like [Harmonia axyridis]XP_045467191.1 relaxin receptor 2-like [Harmonia axyridis]